MIACVTVSARVRFSNDSLVLLLFFPPFFFFWFVFLAQAGGRVPCQHGDCHDAGRQADAGAGLPRPRQPSDRRAQDHGARLASHRRRPGESWGEKKKKERKKERTEKRIARKRVANVLEGVWSGHALKLTLQRDGARPRGISCPRSESPS